MKAGGQPDQKSNKGVCSQLFDKEVHPICTKSMEVLSQSSRLQVYQIIQTKPDPRVEGLLSGHAALKKKKQSSVQNFFPATQEDHCFAPP